MDRCNHPTKRIANGRDYCAVCNQSYGPSGLYVATVYPLYALGTLICGYLAWVIIRGFLANADSITWSLLAAPIGVGILGGLYEVYNYFFPMGGGGGVGDESTIRADDLFDPTSDLYRRHWRYTDRGPRRDN